MTNLKPERARVAARWVLAAVYIAAGMLHLAFPGTFVGIVPAWVPQPDLVVALTGVAQIVGAVGLLIPRLRRAAGVGLAIYAVCVWPANFEHARQALVGGGPSLSLWYHVPRLAFQPVVVWWALWAGAVIDWPFGKRA
ncbi:DoxX family protein [Brevundimonas sp.]|jgi:uncharacterized membrane protein|uniref:DoxX family protein n=1 Tax=Brevundimonas sp. TaxID=1871086 RepID=UPI002E10E23F|nr:DoxX family membrane protein [Brevundimonas sp.]